MMMMYLIGSVLMAVLCLVAAWVSSHADKHILAAAWGLQHGMWVLNIVAAVRQLRND